jgi:hypothetical protein
VINSGPLDHYITASKLAATSDFVVVSVGAKVLTDGLSKSLLLCATSACLFFSLRLEVVEEILV